MWEEVGCLVAGEESITNAPGLSDDKIVANFTYLPLKAPSY